MSALVVTDDTSRDELLEAIAHLNADAKAMRRRGLMGTLSAEYAAIHRCIDAALDDLEMWG